MARAAIAFDQVKLYSWLPAKIESTYENLDTGVDIEFDPVQENDMHNFHLPPNTNAQQLL